jgi:hypothetical protein
MSVKRPPPLHEITERQAAERARKLLDQTELFADIGLGPVAAQSRMLARDVLELVATVKSQPGGPTPLQGRPRMSPRHHRQSRLPGRLRCE